MLIFNFCFVTYFLASQMCDSKYQFCLLDVWTAFFLYVNTYTLQCWHCFLRNLLLLLMLQQLLLLLLLLLLLTATTMTTFTNAISSLLLRSLPRPWHLRLLLWLHFFVDFCWYVCTSIKDWKCWESPHWSQGKADFFQVWKVFVER